MSTSLTTRLLDAMTQLDAAAEVSSDLLALPSVRDPHRLPLNHPRRLRVELTLALGKALATADERKLGELRTVLDRCEDITRRNVWTERAEGEEPVTLYPSRRRDRELRDAA